MIGDGAWTGRRCFVVGGGESFVRIDKRLLADELTLGVNMAFLYGTTATLIGDRRLIHKLSTDPRWGAYRGEKFWLNCEVPTGTERFPGVSELSECVGSDRMPRWSRSMRDGLWRRTNTGASALNLAEVLGADPIYLLGFDMEGGNWHEEYDESWRPKPGAFKKYASDFEENASRVRAKVFNLNPESQLRAFPFAKIEEVFDGHASLRELPHAEVRRKSGKTGGLP